jgi:hypothetical protein
MAEAINPVDQYLALLDQTKKQFDAILPGMEQGINKILGTGPSNVFMNRATPLRQNAEIAAGNNKGLATFSPQKTNPQMDGTQGYVKDMLSTVMSPGGIPTSGTAADRVRQIGFGAGPNKNNFDRYYNHSQYKKLGWNPYVDNEAIYNANSTWTDDWARASTQWMSLAGLGLSQTFNNWDDLFSFNGKGDTKYARDMNRMMSIANSSRGGVGGFAVNLYGNSAYTFGVMSNIILEEIALWGATTLTGGALGGLAAGRTGSNLAKFMKAGKALENAEDVIQAGKTVVQQAPDLNSVSTAANSLSDVNDARKFWKGLGNFVNPFTQTAETVKNIRTGANGFDAMSDWARHSKTFGSFFRDLQMMNASLAESRLEGGMVQNDVFMELYDKYLEENGKAPEGEDANKIMQQAKLAGVSTTQANFPMILVSNKLVFDKALKGFRAFRDNGDSSLGKLVINYGKKAKKKYEGFVDPANPRHWFTTKNGKRIINQFRPQNFAKNGIRYMSANLAEGLQESYQESIAKTMTDYYLETFASPERAGTALFLDKLEAGIGNQFNAQGAETFLSGFLMGGMVQIPQSLVFEYGAQAGKDVYERVSDRKAYDKKIADRKATQDRVINTANEIQADPKKFFNAIYENTQNQKDFANLMSSAEAAGDVKEEKDLVNDAIFKHVQTLLNQGYIDMFTDQIESFQQMNDDELLQAFGYDQNSGKADEFNNDMKGRLNSVLNKVNQIKANHEKYSTIRNPFNPKSGNPAEFEDWYGFEQARDLAIYNDYTYQQAAKRLSSIFNDAAGTKLGAAQSMQLSALFLNDSKGAFGQNMIDTQIDLLEREAAGYADGNEAQKKMGEERKKQAALLRNFKEDFVNYRNEYKQAKKSVANSALRDEVKEDTKTQFTVQQGSTVEYTFKSGTTVTGTVTKKTANKVTIEYTDISGKKVSKSVSIKAKKLKITGGPQGQLPLDFEGNEIEAGLEQRRQELESRIREYLSAISGIPAKSPELDKLILQVTDYAELSEDLSSAMNAVTFLNDPYNYSMAAKQFTQAAKDAREIAKTKMQKSLDEFKTRIGVNELIQKMFLKFNVFFSPEEIEALMKGDRVPSAFYKQNPKTGEFEEVDPTSNLYKEILNFLSEFESEQGFTLKGKVIGEAMDQGGYLIDDMIEADKAPSLKDILTGLGLQPGQDIYTIPIATVLQYILKKRIGSVPSRKMIQNLMTAIDPEENMVISLTSPSGFSYTKETGITIDPRFATKDYSAEVDGKFYTSTLTYLMIHPLTQKIVSDNQSDPGFKAAIQNVMDAFKKYYEDNPDMRQKYGNYVTRMLTSQEAFVAEAFASQAGQKVLAIVPYKNTNRNLWQEFMKALVSFFRKQFGRGVEEIIDDTALTEVLGIVSNKLAGKGVTAPAGTTTAAGTAPAGGIGIVSKPAVTRGTSLDSLKKDYPDLMATLLGQYSIATNKPGVANKEFATWFATSTDPNIDALVDDYNASNGFTEPGPAAPAPAPVSAGQRSSGPISIPTDEELAAEEEETPTDIKTIREQIAEATQEQLDDIVAKVNNQVLQAENLDYETYEKLLADRRNQLEPSGITFDSVNVMTILVMKDKSIYSADGNAIIVAKNDNNKTVVVRNLNLAGEDAILTEQQLREQVEYIKIKDVKTGEIDKVESPVEFTAEEKDLANQSAETATDSEEASKLSSQAFDNAKSKSEDDINDEFDNSLYCN